jgi:hypothetical protein
VQIVEFLVVYLAPTIPAVITFYFLPPNGIRVDLTGKLLGFGIKAGGGVAAYVVFMLLAFWLSPNFFTSDRQVKLYLQLEGDRRAVERLSAIGDSINVVVTSTQGDQKEYRFFGFATFGGRRTLLASASVKRDDIGRTYTAKVSPPLENVEYVIDGGNNGTRFVLKDETTLTLSLKLLSDDPLDVDATIFHTNDWINALSVSALAFNKIQPADLDAVRQLTGGKEFIKASEELVSLGVFLNETDHPLAEIALTDYTNSDPTIKPSVIEATARRISGEEHRALSLKLAKKGDFFSKDSSEIFDGLVELTSNYKRAGGEMGYIKVVRGEKVESRGSSLDLRKGAAFRIGPVLQPIQPGEGVALVVRFYYDYYWEPIKPGVEDWVGERVAYPTRLSILSVKLGIDDATFNVSSFRSDFTLPDGRRSSNIPNFRSKISPKYITVQSAILDRGVKEQFFWAWQ